MEESQDQIVTTLVPVEVEGRNAGEYAIVEGLGSF